MIIKAKEKLLQLSPEQNAHKMINIAKVEPTLQPTTQDELENDEYFYVKQNIGVDIEEDWLEVNISDIHTS